MLNEHRLRQAIDLVKERGWDLLVLYGHTWRKDYFRCLLNVNFSGPHAAAIVFASGEVHAIVTDPWDAELIAPHAEVSMANDFAEGLSRYATSWSSGVAGLELMEARFAQA